MARIFITGSADGLGQLAAQSLIKQGHKVVLHARNSERGDDALKSNPNAEAVLIGDLSDISETKKANKLGIFDAVIHNAGVYQAQEKNLFTVNTLAPYILSCLIAKPKRCSGMHQGVKPKLESLKNDISIINYSDTKLYVIMLSNAVDPGWVPTKMPPR